MGNYRSSARRKLRIMLFKIFNRRIINIRDIRLVRASPRLCFFYYDNYDTQRWCYLLYFKREHQILPEHFYLMLSIFISENSILDDSEHVDEIISSRHKCSICIRADNCSVLYPK